MKSLAKFLSCFGLIEDLWITLFSFGIPADFTDDIDVTRVVKHDFYAHQVSMRPPTSALHPSNLTFLHEFMSLFRMTS
jgi:hypothetical protein